MAHAGPAARINEVPATMTAPSATIRPADVSTTETTPLCSAIDRQSSRPPISPTGTPTATATIDATNPCQQMVAAVCPGVPPSARIVASSTRRLRPVTISECSMRSDPRSATNRPM